LESELEKEIVLPEGIGERVDNKIPEKIRENEAVQSTRKKVLPKRLKTV